MSSPPPIPPSLSALPQRLTLSPDGSLGIKTPAAPTESLEVVGNAIVSERVTVAGLTVTGSNAAVTTLQTPTTITGPVTLEGAFTMPVLGFAANLGALQVTAGGLVGIGTAPNGAGGVVLDLGGVGGISAGSVSAAGTVTASAGFVGNGAGLTGFAASARTDATNATNITAGTLGTARLPARLPATISASGFVGVGTTAAPGVGGSGGRGLAGAPRLDLVAEALTARPCAIPPAPMTAAETVFVAGVPAHLAGTYTASASTEAPGTAAYFAMDAEDAGVNVWQSISEYAPTYAPAGVPITTRDAQNVTYSGHYIQLATQIANSSGLAVTGYEIAAGSAFTAPASWVLLGSVLGNTWTVLDSVTDTTALADAAAGAAPAEPVRFGITGAPAGLAVYRLVVTKTAGGNPATPARAGLATFRLTTTHGVRLSVPLRVAPADAAGTGLFVTPKGYVGIGTETPTAALHVATAAGAPRFAALGNGGSTIPLAVDALGNLTTTLSDARLKHRIRPLSYGLADICALRPVHYEWVPEHAALRGAREQIGLLAQDVAEVIPEAVAAAQKEPAGGPAAAAPGPLLSLDATALIPVLIRAVQEVAERLERLETRMSHVSSAYAAPHGSYASLPGSRRGSDGGAA